jgi:hypothetical protein
MIVIASLEAIGLVVVVLLFLRAQESAGRAWADERRELLNRVQRPDILPLAAANTFVQPDPEPDEIDMVGTIDYADDE